LGLRGGQGGLIALDPLPPCVLMLRRIEIVPTEPAVRRIFDLSASRSPECCDESQNILLLGLGQGLMRRGAFIRGKPSETAEHKSSRDYPVRAGAPIRPKLEASEHGQTQAKPYPNHGRTRCESRRASEKVDGDAPKDSSC